MKAHYFFLFLTIIAFSCADSTDNDDNYVLFYENQFNQEDSIWQYNIVLDTSIYSYWLNDSSAYCKIEDGALKLHCSYYECEGAFVKATLPFSKINFDSYLKGETIIKIGVNSFYYELTTDYVPNPNFYIVLKNYRYSFHPDFTHWTSNDIETINNSYFVISYYIKDYEILETRINGSRIDNSIWRNEYTEDTNFLEIWNVIGGMMCIGEGSLDISIDYVELYYKP